MAASAVTISVTDFWHDGKREHVIGTLAIGASPGTYVTNGLALSFTGQEFIKSSTAPLFVRAQGLAGYLYTYDKTNKTLRVFRGGGFTPAGTIGAVTPAGTIGAVTPAGTIGAITPAGTNTAPTITTGTNATVTAVIATNAGALTQAAGQTGLTGVQAPVFSGSPVTPVFTGSPFTATFTGSPFTATFTGTAVAATTFVELTNTLSTPAGLSGDTIDFYAIFKLI